ncbi:N-acetyltransferase [Desulfitobacterium metallireducens]|uniref:Acetyltransferase n=1 Tax=Desulfitobacterium metallireducens DSM 15288 TaxID=871968 RepID=W0EC96_9FIRM|nr:N-acetyltransferase [Desulfitobacterium metallireducens]AHF06666.1 acetyltransferase [Desulfitobacterium metallireducens DSM 15288]
MEIRTAKLTDVEQIQKLINGFAEEGLMLARSRHMLCEHIREFKVYEDDGEIKGVGSLHILWDDLAEIRALAIDKNYQRKGLGRMIVESLLQEAKELGVPKAFTLTYQPEFFARLGFQSVNKDELPQKVWQECLYCIKFPNCDENALLIDVNKKDGELTPPGKTVF